MTFLRFEIKHWLRAPMPWIFFFVFALLSFGATVSDDVSIGGGYGNIWKNAPFVAQSFYAIFSILGILLVTAFMNGAALRDFENNTHQIVFSSPVSKAGYYFGHFFGAVIVALIPMLGLSLGMWMGVLLNPVFDFMDAGRYGPLEVKGHLLGILVFVIPNIVFCGGIVYAVAANTRSVMYAFIAAMTILVGYIAAGSFMKDIENETLGALLDPMGVRTHSLLTKYWTPDDKNHNALSISGLMLYNRLIWMAVGMAILAVGYRFFSFSEKNKTTKKELKSDQTEIKSPLSKVSFPKVTPQSGLGTQLLQLGSQFKTDFWGIVKSTPFILLLSIGLLNMLPNLTSATEGYGGKELPVTYNLVNLARGSFYLFLVAIIVYFSGLIIWKERMAKVNEIFDALPTRTWTVLVGKFLAIVAILVIIQSFIIGILVFTQKMFGYTRHELSVFANELLWYDLLGFIVLVAFSMLIHSLSKNMYLGFFIGVIFIMLNSFIWSPLDISSNMLKFGSTPSYIYSDMFRYAPYLGALNWFHAYWIVFATLLLIGTILMYPRGKETGWEKRFSIARQEWKTYRAFGFAAVVLWSGLGSWVFYNTKILNKIKSSKTREQQQVDFEKKYKRFEGIAQPRVFDIKYDIQVFPEIRRLQAGGVLRARNVAAQPIDSLHIITPLNGKHSLRGERLNLIFEDSVLHYQIYSISPALQVRDTLTLEFSTVFEPKGFENEVSFVEINQNGSFFNNTDIAPTIGYTDRFEMDDKNDRKKYGLPEKSRLPELNPQDTANRRNSYISNHADWVQVETTISTSADQIAIAPGSLVKIWSEGERKFFQYKLDHESLNFYAFMSARYEVARREWNGISLEVYYDKKHEYNVERMLNSMQKSLEYYTQNFGPYYHKQCRIIEFPRIAEFAQAFPGTMPYSEGIGFIQDFSDEEDIDKVFYVVAHEMGHQWWAHQECGAQMQGGEMLVETFAQYSALMVMEHEYGNDKMRKFLGYEADRYLRGRGSERDREMPIGKCENQGYIHYAKGSLVMYYLKEMIGEEQVNTALRRFLEKYRYAPPPYPVSTDVISEFEKNTPDSLSYIIQDLFWDITLFDNRCLETILRELPDGKYEVTIKTESKKLKSDEKGKEVEVPVGDFIEIGAFAKPAAGKKYGKTLYRQRVKITKLENEFRFIVDEKPYEAGIDPFRLLIDRNPKDNVKKFGSGSK